MCRRRTAVALLAVLALCSVGFGSVTAAQTPDELPVPELAPVVFHTADGREVTMMVEIAATPSVRTCGLGYRMVMPEDQGMLFVMEGDSAGPFWDRNTFIPLTLAWLAADGAILQLTDMAAISPDDQPQHNTLYPPSVVYRFVIEANQGWFERNGVAAGDQADLTEALARALGMAERSTLCDSMGY